MPPAVVPAFVGLVLVLPPFCLARGESAIDESGKREPQGANEPSVPTGLILPSLTGPRPWTDKPVLDQGRRFHFAVLADNAGQPRPGVWSKAIERLNLLRPAFVISVGDYIQGARGDNPDRATVAARWDQFLSMLERLEMKFFFVEGDHDATNPMMHAMWRERFGPEWYSFDFQNAHFVCVSSEDEVARIGDTQLAWLASDLRAHHDSRWTFLFMHQPLWVMAETALAAGKPDPTNWKKVESLLTGRPHTVFVGHAHHYEMFERNGASYYQLATTGGKSSMRGRVYGEFDHLVWVTMEDHGPRLANLLLDGIVPGDVVVEAQNQRFRRFRFQSTLVACALVAALAAAWVGWAARHLARRRRASANPGSADRAPSGGLVIMLALTACASIGVLCALLILHGGDESGIPWSLCTLAMVATAGACFTVAHIAHSRVRLGHAETAWSRLPLWSAASAAALFVVILAYYLNAWHLSGLDARENFWQLLMH